MHESTVMQAHWPYQWHAWVCDVCHNPFVLAEDARTCEEQHEAQQNDECSCYCCLEENCKKH